MLVYLFFFATVSFFWAMGQFSRGDLRRISKIFFFGSLFIFAGLRGSVGSDTFAYLYLFDNLNGFNDFLVFAQKYEIGFLALVYFLRKLSESQFFYLIAISAIQVFIFYRISRKVKNNLFVLIYALLFYLNFHFNTVRAGFAALLLLNYMVEKDEVAKKISAIAAPFFHVSILFFYPFFVFKPTFKSIFSFLLISIVLGLYFSEYVYVFVDKLFTYDSYLAGDGGVSWFGVIYCLVIIFYLFGIKNSSANFKVSSIVLLVLYIFKFNFPIIYRLIFIMQFYYFLALIQCFDERLLEKRKFIFIWPMVFIMFVFQLRGIYLEDSGLILRVDSGELSVNSLDWTYLPYELYWNDPLVK